MKAFRKLLVVFLLAALMLIPAACQVNGGDPQETPPTLTVSAASVNGRVREQIVLPTATAKDHSENDISEEIRIKIYFKEDEEYVLPKKNASLGVPLSENPTFTPSKCGEYEITYFVADEKGNESESKVALAVASNPDSVLSQNLASVNNIGNWLYGQEGQNSALNAFGEITVAGKNESTEYGGASYKGQKIKNGDTVTVEFIAKEPENVWFYDFVYLLTPSASADAPTADEARWPSYYHIRVGKNMSEGYLFTLNNTNHAMFEPIHATLLDGKQHSLSLKIEASEEQVEVFCWVDKDIMSSPSVVNTVYKTDVAERYPDNAAALVPFQSNAEGWLSFGANVTGANTANDELVIKGVTINGEAMLKAPSIEVEEMESMRVGEEAQLPAATAKDENDYSDLTADVKQYIKTPAGEFEEISEKTYTPEEAGEYILRYTVTDGSGNLGYREFAVLCSKGESTELPVIDFGEEEIDTVTANLNEPTAIPVPVSVTDSFGDDISSRLSVELIGREKVLLKGLREYTFRAAGENTLRYSVSDYNGNVTVKDIKVVVAGSATGNILENGDDWFFHGATYDENADTVRIDQSGTTIVYGGQKVYDETVSVLWNFDAAQAAGGADGTNILIINLRGGKTQDTVKTNSNPNGNTNWSWPEGLSVVFSRHYGILVKLGGWNAATIATSVKQDTELYELFHGKDTVLSVKITDVVGENGEVEAVRLEVKVDGERIAFSGSYLDAETGDVLLNKRYLRANPSVLEAGWLDFYFNDVDTVDNERTIIKAITLDGTAPVQTVISIDKEADQQFVMNEAYTLPVVTVTVGEEDRSNEVKAYIAAVGEQPDFTAQPYAAATIVPGLEYIKGFTVYYVYGGKVVKTVTVTNSSEIELTLSSEEVTGAKVNTEFALPTVTAAMLGSLDVSDDISVKLKVGVFEYEAGETYKPTSDETVQISYIFYGRVVKTVNVTVAPDVSSSTDFAGWTYVTGGQAVSWKSQKIYNNKIYLRFSFAKQFAAGDLYEFPLRGGETDGGAWMSYPTGLNLSLFKDENGVRFRVHSNPEGHYPKTVYGVSANSYANLDWTARHSLVYSVYDRYEGDTFLGVAIEVWLDGDKVEFSAGEAGTVSEGSVLIPAETVLKNPKDKNGRTIFTDSFFAVFGMQNGATISQPMNVHHAYIMKPTDALPQMPEDPAVFTIDKEENQTFVMGEAYVLPVLTAKVGSEDRSDRVKVYISANGTPDLSGEAYTETTYTPVAADYKGFTVYYVYEGNIVKEVSVANSAVVELTLSTETVEATAGAAFTVPTVTAAALSGVNVSDEITVKIVVDGVQTDAGETFTPLSAGTLQIVYYFDGEAVKTLTVEVTEGGAQLELVLSAEEVTATIGQAFTVPTVVSAMLGGQDHKDEIGVKLVAAGRVVGENIATYTPWYDETIYIVYSYGGSDVKTIEVPVPPVTDSKTDIAAQFEETPEKAMRYNKQFLYNNKVYLNFTMTGGLSASDCYYFGLRGNEQDPGAWCQWPDGLRISLYSDPTWGTYFEILYGPHNEKLVKVAESTHKYPNNSGGDIAIDWTKPHTMVYGAYDVYSEDGATYLGLMVELTLDGAQVAFGVQGGGTAIGATAQDGKILIPAAKVLENPVFTEGRPVFDKSLFYIWQRGNAVEAITVNRAYIMKPTDKVPADPIDITTSGKIASTNSNSWAYTAKSVLNRRVDMTFSVDMTGKTFSFMQFGLRGSSDNAGDWFWNNTGLVLGIYHNDTWGDGFLVTYGCSEWNSFGEGKDRIKFIDWTVEHTISYSVWNVYGDNGELIGIKVSVMFDGAQIVFGSAADASELFIAKETYEQKVSDSVPASTFEQASYVFVWSGNNAPITVTEATLTEL